MNLLELNSIVAGKYTEGVGKNKTTRCITEEEFEDFRAMLSVNPANRDFLNRTETASEFYEHVELADKYIDKEIKEDAFYAAKLGFFYAGVPSKLVYILRKAIRKYQSPNLALSAIDVRTISKYLKEGALPEGITIKNVIESILGRQCELLTSYRRKVKFKDWYEVYVPDVDRVLLLPEDLAKHIESLEDLENINYRKDVGVCVYDIPIRTMGNKVGVTVDEFDLRKCE